MPAIQSLSRLGISPLIQVTPLPVSQDSPAAKKTTPSKRSSSRRSQQNPANTTSSTSNPTSRAKPPSKLTREPLLALCAEQGVEIDLTKYKSNTAINRRRKEVLKERTAREKKEEQARLRLEKTRARQPSVARHLSPKRKKPSSAKKKVSIAAEASPLSGPNGDNLDDDPDATPSSSAQHRFTALAAGLADADDSDDDEEGEGEDGEEELADLDDPLAAARRDGVDLDQLVKVLNCSAFDDSSTTSRRQEAVAEMQLTVSDARNKTQAHTEKSAQRLFAAWFRLVREDPLLEISDYIVDEYVAKLYIDWTLTRGCYNRRAQLEKGKRVDAATIDKAWSMLARLRKNQHAHSLRASPPVDLDQTRPFSTAQLLAFKDSCTVQATVHAREIAAVDLFSNTFLEFAAWDAERVGAVAEGLFCKPQGPTILRSHLMFSWCMQSLNRLDDLVLTRLAYLSLSEIKIGKGEKVPVIVAQQFEGKTRQKKSKKKAHFAILAPHRDFRVCAVGSLAAFLYYLFDESKITSNEKWTGVDWNWNDDASWRPIYLMAGVLNAQTHLSKTTLTRSFTILFEAMGIISSKKGHLGRVVGGWLMESLGCPENEILRTGDWKGDIYQTVYASQIPRTGIKTAAGFEHDEAMSWPRLEVEIPDELLQGIFGWVESTLATPVTPSARRFLLLLIFLRKHFIIHFANWYQTNSNSVVFSSLAIFKGGDSNPYLRWFRDSFPALLAAQEAKAKAADALLAEVKDAATRSLLSVLLRNTESLQTSMSSFEVMVERRTADLSPSKRSRLPEDDEASSSDDEEPSSSSSSKRRRPPSRPSQPRLLSASSFLPLSPAHLPPSPSRPAPSTSSPNPSSASPSSSSSPSRLPAPAAPRQPASGVTDRLARPTSHQSTPPPSPTAEAAQPSTPKRLRAEFDGPHPSPRRLHITPTLSSSEPAPACAYDFLLPPDLAFSSRPNDPSPPAPVFRQPATWTTILDAVKQPKAVWEVWGPKQPGQYADLSEVWAHWAVEGVGVDAAGRPGRVPPISELEKRWPSRNKKLDQRWSGGLAAAPRRRLAQFRLLIKALQERQGPSTSLRDAAQALAADLGVPEDQVAAIGEELRRRSAAASGGRRKKKRVEEEVEVEEPLPAN